MSPSEGRGREGSSSSLEKVPCGKGSRDYVAMFQITAWVDKECKRFCYRNYLSVPPVGHCAGSSNVILILFNRARKVLKKFLLQPDAPLCTNLSNFIHSTLTMVDAMD